MCARRGEAQAVPRGCVPGVCSGVLASWDLGRWLVWGQGRHPLPALCHPCRDSQPRVCDGLQAPSSWRGSECGLSPAAHLWWEKGAFLPELSAWTPAARTRAGTVGQCPEGAVPTAGCSPLSLRIRGCRSQFERLEAALRVRVRRPLELLSDKLKTSMRRAGGAGHRL